MINEIQRKEKLCTSTDSCAADPTLLERFEFRNIRQEEADQAVRIEEICFPPNEACSEKNMKDRIAAASELFLVAVDKKTGKIAGFLNGLATDEEVFRDQFFTEAGLYCPEGKNVMLLGLDVLPQYRLQGLGRELVFQYSQRERNKGRQMLLLTCLKEKVEMYEKFGFLDRGLANSSWGGEEWHEMICSLNIRVLERKDNKAIESVIRSCLIEFGADHEGTAWADPNLGCFSEIYHSEGNCYWVAEDSQGRIVGGAGIGMLDAEKKICELQKMYCLPEARGTGISHLLMETALAYAARYYKQCYLETLENMTAARKFYEKYGFRRIYEAVGQTTHFACDVRYIRELN